MVLDFAFMRRALLIFGLVLLLVAPFSTDPLPFAVGCMTPWVLISIINKPNMPVAAIFYFFWQWAQIFARVLQSLIDGEALAKGYSGPGVVYAYWYSLAGLVALAVAFRLVLGNLPRPTQEEEDAHLSWRPRDLLMLYAGTLVLAVICGFGARYLSSLGQPFEAMGRLKVVAEFLLFTTVLATRRDYKFMTAAALIEIGIGFTGLLSDFRGVFIYLAMAAIAARIRLSAMAIVGGIAWFALLVALGLFWTAVKVDYRQFATEGEETQNLSVPLGDRMAYLGNLAMNPGEIDWGLASYGMLSRFAYIDIFGTVITVQDATRNPPTMRQWTEALEHVFKPRFIFPDKAPLSDSETYARLIGADPAKTVRGDTSISVGYFGENYVDLGFPGMLVGMFVLGLMISGVIRYFMQVRTLPLMVRQGIALAFIYHVCGSGIEISLPKLFGSIIMFFLVYLLLVKFVLPIALQWLNARSEAKETSQPS